MAARGSIGAAVLSPARVRARRSRTARPLLLALLILLLVLAGLAVRLASESLPPVALRTLLPATVKLPGKAPQLAWPADGEAAVEVPGVGRLATESSTRAVPIASVTKVMTAYLTLKKYPLSGRGFELEITPTDLNREREDVAQDESVLPVAVGERLSERQALEGLLLPSGNNIAELLAIKDAGSVRAFLARMNASARALGMAQTRYTDPSGFNASTVSTASDQLKLTRVAMTEPGFAGVVDEREADLPVAGHVENLNALLGEEGYVGIKTGSDSAAGGCLMFAKAVTLAGRRVTVLGVVLGQRGGSYVPAALYSARRLGNSVAAALGVRTVIPRGAPVLSAESASGKRTTAVASAPLQVLGWAGLRVSLAIARAKPGSSVRAGETLGSVHLEGSFLLASPRASAYARARSALAKPSLGWRLNHLF